MRIQSLVPSRLASWRVGSFLLGLAGIYVAICSPLDTFGGLLLSVHMIQHLLLMMVIPPLLLLGHPYLPMISGLPRSSARGFFAPIINAKGVRRLGYFLSDYRVAWIFYVIVTLGWHVPVLYELTLRSPYWHAVEHTCFLTAGIMFWWFVVRPWPSRPRAPRWLTIPYLLLADISNTALSAFLSFSDRVIYPTYARVPHFHGSSPVADQNLAGAIMWVPGSVLYLIPAGVIAVSFLSPTRRAPDLAAVAGSRKQTLLLVSKIWDLVFTRILASIQFRRTIQAGMFGLAIAICLDGWFGPQIGPMNLAGVLPWTHWRGLTVLALAIAGNFFCFACPFTFARDLARRIFPATHRWPRSLRSKWLAAFLVILYLWSYEAFGLWNRPWITAWIITAYFVAAVLIDGWFRDASFCRYVCPIGQFHFVQSLVSPLEVRVSQPAVCQSCRTHDCIRGNDQQRGCELHLFQPRKRSNLDCTFCLDCVRACPHDNVKLAAVAPGREIWHDQFRSSVGRLARRSDLAFLASVLIFGAFVNAAGMSLPFVDGFQSVRVQLGLIDRPVLLGIFFIGCLIVVPFGLLNGCAALSRRLGSLQVDQNTVVNRCSFALVPLGAAMWFAHLVFHLFTGSHTIVPVIERLAGSHQPNWSILGWNFRQLIDLQFLALDLGLLLCLYAFWRIAREWTGSSIRLSREMLGAFLPGCLLALTLFAVGGWIIFQPMQMRGTFFH